MGEIFGWFIVFNECDCFTAWHCRKGWNDALYGYVEVKIACTHTQNHHHSAPL